MVNTILIQCSYPFKLAEAKFAMDLVIPSVETSTSLTEDQAKEMKKMLENREVKYIDFNDKANEGVQAPIQANCDCFTCKNHTKAYVNHLVLCDEVNWCMLLTM